MPFDPNDKQYLDNLFNMTSRGAFSGYTPDQIAQETDAVDTAPGSVSEDERWPLYLQGYAFNRCYNNSFDSPPPLGTGTYLSETENKLPGWTFVDGSTSQTGKCMWSEHVDGSDRHVEFYADNTMSVNDRIYVEQLIYNPARGINLFNFYASMNAYEAAAGITVGTDVDQFIEVEWTKYDGTVHTTDTVYFEQGDNESGNCRMWFSASPGAATYALVRVGYRIKSTENLTATPAAIGVINGCDFTRPETAYMTLKFSYGNATAHQQLSASTTYLMEAEDALVHETAAKYYASAPGFIMGMTTATDSTISAGKINFRPRAGGTAFDWAGDPDLTNPAHELGHDVESRGSTDYLNYATQGKTLNGNTVYDFLNGQAIQMEMVTSGTFNATPGCFTATVLIMLAYHEAGSAAAGESLESLGLWWRRQSAGLDFFQEATEEERDRLERLQAANIERLEDELARLREQNEVLRRALNCEDDEG
jgi:hypothetical protein